MRSSRTPVRSTPIWHLGDVVGYGPDPDGVVARLIEVGAVGVRGNHDAAALGGREIDWFNPEARAAAEWTRDTIDGTTRAWLSALPERHAIGRMTLVHGSPRDPIREYVSSADVALENLAVLETDFGLHGHTHVPVAFCLGPDERLQVVGPGPGRARTASSRSTANGRSSTRAASASRGTAIPMPRT